jgi:hypothetical protein
LSAYAMIVFGVDSPPTIRAPSLLVRNQEQEAKSSAGCCITLVCVLPNKCVNGS